MSTLIELWEEIRPKAQQAFVTELKREVVPGHLLYKVPVEAIARRSGTDDVLFAILGSASVAVVHLSYSKETNPQWPRTEFFADLSEWKAHCLRQSLGTTGEL